MNNNWEYPLFNNHRLSTKASLGRFVMFINDINIFSFLSDDEPQDLFLRPFHTTPKAFAQGFFLLVFFLFQSRGIKDIAYIELIN